MKSGVRAIGIDDGPQSARTLLVGVVMRKDRVEGILSTRVPLDGYNATSKMEKMAKGRFYPQLRCVFLDGVAVAGFNLVNFHELSKQLSLPVIVCTSNRPQPRKFGKTLVRWPRKSKQWESITVPAHKLGGIWYQFAGCTRHQAESMIRQFQVHAEIPEPLRLAHLIAAGIEAGESKGL